MATNISRATSAPNSPLLPRGPKARPRLRNAWRSFSFRVIAQLQDARALMWEAIQLLDQVWKETPRYSDRYHLFRLVAHLAKYWTAELAVQFAKWNMEVHGGMGVLAEYSAERWLREAMILPIWEGTPHRQMLDGLE